MRGNNRRPHVRRRRGMVLVLVLVVIALLTLACLTFSRLMLTERKGALLSARRAQARLSADSGIEMIKVFLAAGKEVQDESGGWYNNELVFRGRLVADEEATGGPGRFTVVAPQMTDGIAQGIRFGLEDESTRLNLNVLTALDEALPGTGRQLLMGLPGMTEDVADAILDWMDKDDDPREYGAEFDHYATLDSPYAPKNGPLETVEELLLVRDVTPWLLFGADANHNGSVDVDEPTSATLQEQYIDNTDGSMDRGWASYLTLYSVESNVSPDGVEKIDLNQDDLETLFTELETALSTEWATFIVAYRQAGPYTGTEEGVSDATGQLDFGQQGKTKLTTVLDLIGSNVRIKFDGDEEETVLATPFSELPIAMRLYLPLLMDNVAVNTKTRIPGRININQASEVILSGIPGMTAEVLDSILTQRQPDPLEAVDSQRHETWLLAEGIVTVAEMKSLIPFMTAGGCVYRVQIIGYGENGGPPVRIEAVLDTGEGEAQLVFYRNLSHLGRGFSLETLGVSMGDGF